MANLIDYTRSLVLPLQTDLTDVPFSNCILHCLTFLQINTMPTDVITVQLAFHIANLIYCWLKNTKKFTIFLHELEWTLFLVGGKAIKALI